MATSPTCSAKAMSGRRARPATPTNVQVDVDGGGDNFVTVAVLNGSISNSTLASQTVILNDTLVA